MSRDDHAVQSMSHGGQTKN